MAKNPTIAVIIVNWNKKDILLDLLEQLGKNTGPLFDVILVDNASTDDSVDAVMNSYTDVKIIANEKNLGGTGGFNTGLRYALSHGGYDYIWLLDNDVEIQDNTLSELLKLMISDKDVGMVGSRIMDIEDRYTTVETGGNLRRDMMGVIPINRNSREDVTDSSYVDYVAVCSALIRVSALKKTGLMDDRFFVLWDDMDWGMSFKKQGYKIIAAPNSIVYHGSFTERDRGDEINYYYGIRNPLLAYTKHTSFLKLIFIFYRSLRYYSRIFVFFMYCGRKYEAGLMRKALIDFMCNRWGKFISKKNDIKNIEASTKKEHAEPDNIYRRVLVSTIGISKISCDIIIKKLKSTYPEAEITLLIHQDRASYFNGLPHYTLDKKRMNDTRYIFNKFIDVKLQQYDALVYMMPTPFIYASKRGILVNSNGEMITYKRSGSNSILLLALEMCLSELIAHFMLPFLLIKSLRYS